MKYTNKNNLPEEIVRAVQQDTYSKGEASISVTGLLSAPRPNILAREHHSELVVDVSDEIWKILGTASHYIMEQANIGHEGTITEERLYWNVRGWTISGQFDSMSLKDSTLRDLKVTSSWTVMHALKEGKIEWEQQLNCYAWLYKKNHNKDVEKLEIITINRDWSERQKQRSGGDYPDAQVSVIPINLWTEEEQEEFIVSRVKAHQEADADFLISKDLPLCTDEERWKQADSYRVLKKNRVRAIRVFNTEEEVNDFINEQNDKDLYVDFVKGESRKCKDYCNVSQFCNQYAMEVADE